MLAVNGGPGITFLFCVIPVRSVAGELQVQLTFLHLGFLNAEEVCVKGLEDVCKALACHGPQAVNVPGDKLHAILLSIQHRS